MRSQRRGDGFLQGVLSLAAANLVTRALAAVYKPLVTRIFALYDGYLGDAGMGLAQVPVSIYQVVLSFSSSGFNIAISKLVAERLAAGDAKGAARTFKVALWTMGVLGATLSAGFYLGAGVWANLAGVPQATLGFQAMAPAMMLMSLTAAYRGLLQGHEAMARAGASQVLEQVVRVLSGTGLVLWLAPRSVVLGAAGFNFSDVPAALVALAYLLWSCQRFSRGPAQATPGSEPAPATVHSMVPTNRAGTGRASQEVSLTGLVRELLTLALPIAVIGALLPLMQALDTFMVFHRLTRLGLSPGAVQAAYGQLTNAFALVFLPTVLTGALYVSLIPAIAGAMARGDGATVERTVSSAYRMTLLVALPAAIGLWVLADPIYRLVFGGTGGPVLAAMSWVTLALMVQQSSSGVLQGMGRVTMATRNLLAGVAVKVVLTYVLTGQSEIGVRGAAYGTAVGFAVTALLNFFGARPHPRQLLAKIGPGQIAAAAATMGVGVSVASWTLRFAPAAFVTVISVTVGGALYLVSLIGLRALGHREIEALPWGRTLASWLSRRQLLQDRDD